MTPALALSILESFVQGHASLPFAQDAVTALLEGLAPPLLVSDDDDTTNRKVWLRNALAVAASSCYGRDMATFNERALHRPPVLPPVVPVRSGPQRALRIVK